jgi:hypothetical protein
VADFFVSLGSGGGKQAYKLTPKVESLRGVLRGADLSKDDYRRHLEEKYR